MNFHTNPRLLYLTSLLIFVALSLAIAIYPAIEASKVPPAPGLEPLSPSAQRGREIYVAEGCSYCHTQQVRPLPQDQIFGRPSAPGDFAYSTPQLLGTERTGPDLANVGNRQPSSTWHLIHLYNPRAVVRESIMPAYWWYFQRKDQAGPGEVVVPVPDAWKPKGKVVVATPDALALVDYLLALKQPAVSAPSTGAGK
ncbi:MAG: cbb3-type cytochrome c oxidase subunit II [Candidatus Tectomicrobia bacterium]|uniref:Cbb3-type cytochrome c oxidase subunit II n=1 Tax=Tectimicrobiota bacterium TaxID=2528274 RepID=A0A932GQB5_UNCTE|nr:cbb3-type cytochrome c oxidase subunit II [Candidatus Tectomicrobia bacterium]